MSAGRTLPPWWVVAGVALAFAVFIPSVYNAAHWVGRPFPGFFYLENGVVVSIGRGDWMPPQHRRAEWTRVLAVDRQPVPDGHAIHALVTAAGAGHAATFTFRGGSEVFRLALDVRAFSPGDFFELFAPMLLVGLLMVLIGAGTVARRPHAPEARALFGVCMSLGLALIAAPDVYGPYWLSPVFFLGLCLVPPAIAHVALAYPRPALLRVGAWLPAALYAPFVGLGIGLLGSLPDPAIFLPLLYSVYFFLANATLLYVGGLVLAMIDGLQPRRGLLLAIGGVVAGSSLAIGVLVTYPLLQRPISAAWLLAPLLVLFALTGMAFVRFPAEGYRVAA